MISQQDIQALKDYVKGPSSQNQADSTVRLQVTHSNLKAYFMEIRLDLHVSVSSHTHKHTLQQYSSASATMPHASMQAVSTDDNNWRQAEIDESYRQQSQQYAAAA